MSTSLRIALSPYHLSTREAPAMLALILGTHVVTLMPRPPEGTSREAVRAAVDAAPRYLRLMESWRWSSPLWQSGVIASGLADDQPADELEGVYADIDHADALSSLRPLTRSATQRAAESPDKSLDFIAADVLKGGPDPGINIPICAALDRFAARHRICVVRGGMPSIAQRAESRLGERVFSFAMPILLRAGGGRIGRLRDDLAKPLQALRNAIEAAVDAAIDAADADQLKMSVEAVSKAAAVYGKAFAEWAPRRAIGDDENAERVVAGYVSVTGQIMPADAVLRASRAAISAVRATSFEDHEPMPGADDKLFTLMVREMTVKPEV